MTYDPFHAPAQTVEPEPPVRLYELHRGAETFRAEIRWRGEFGAELQLYRNGEFVFGRLYETGIGAESEVGAGWDILVLVDGEPSFSRRCSERIKRGKPPKARDRSHLEILGDHLKRFQT